MLLSYGAFLFFVLNYPSPGVENRKRTAGRRFFCVSP